MFLIFLRCSLIFHSEFVVFSVIKMRLPSAATEVCVPELISTVLNLIGESQCGAVSSGGKLLVLMTSKLC